MHTRLFAPEWVQTGVPVPGPVFPWNWDLGTDEDHNARVGAALANGLASEVLPRIESWFDPEVMAHTLEDLSRGIDRGTGTFSGLNPGPRAVAMALLDVEGADERLTQTLALLPADDMVRQWIEQRLEQRAVTA